MSEELKNNTKVKFDDLMRAGKYFETHVVPLEEGARIFTGNDKFVYKNSKWNLRLNEDDR